MRRAVLVVLAVSLVCLAAGPVAAGEDYLVIKAKAPEPAPTATEAVVYVVRPAFTGKAVKFWAFMDSTPIGVTKGKTYFAVRVPAGTHLFWSRAENVAALQLEVEAGKVYYLKQKARMGGFKARVKLEVLGVAEAKAALEKCKVAEMTAAGRQRAAEIAAEKYQTAKEKAAAADEGDD